jgi:hypothetical protein
VAALRLLTGALGLWVAAASQVDLDGLGGFGLGDELGPMGWAALATLTCAFVISVFGRALPALGWGALGTFAVLIHGTPALLYGTPR